MPPQSHRPVGTGLIIPCLLLLGGFAIWLTRGTTPVQPAATGPELIQAAERTEDKRGSADGGAQALRAGVATDQHVETTDATELVRARAPDPHKIVLTGRLIDTTGNPVADARCGLRSFAQPDLMLEWVTLHGEVEWRVPSDQRSGNDGRFRFDLEIPRPFSFELEVFPEDELSLLAEFGPFEEDQTLDLGDIVLTRGVKVSGRLIQADGQPFRPDAIRSDRGGSVTIQRFGHGPDRPHGFRARTYHSADVDLEGRFEFDTRIEPGTWYAGGLPFRLTGEPRRFDQAEVMVGDSDTIWDLVAVAADAIDFVSGRVLDQYGAPVVNTRIHTTHVPSSDHTQTDIDGLFVLRRKQRDKTSTKVGFSLEHPGYTLSAEQPLQPWGTEDIELRAERGPFLDLLVLSAIDRQPVEEYSAWLHHYRPGWGSHDGGEVTRTSGEQPGGTSRIGPFNPGHYQVEVRGAEGSGLSAISTPIDMELNRPAQLTLVLPRQIEQRLVVQTSTGVPVTGSIVTLIDPHQVEIGLDTRVFDRKHGVQGSGQKGHVVSSGVTDEKGRTALAAPLGQRLVLRVTGQHEPLILNSFIPDEDEQTIQLAPAATVGFRIEPRSVVDHWYALRSSIDQRMRKFTHPRVILTSLEDPSREYPILSSPRRRKVNGAIEEDGTAELLAVPTGRWKVRIEYPTGEAYSSSFQTTDSLDTITIEAGERIEHALDLSAEQPGRLDLTIRVDGELFHGKIEVSKLSGPNGHESGRSRDARTDPNGQAALDLAPGWWRIECEIPFAHSASWVSAEIEAEVRTGETTRRQLELQTGTAVLRLTTPSGEALPNQAGLRAVHVASGRTAVARAGQEPGQWFVMGLAGAHRLSVPIRSLARGRDWQKFRKEVMAGWQRGTSPAAYEARLQSEGRVVLGTVELGSGSSVIELQVPADWDR